MVLVTSEQMQALDRHTISTLRVPGIVLMDHAGKEVARVALDRRPRSVVVVCGKGNNGADGWIAARWLRHWGIPVEVVSVVPPDTLQGDAALAANMALAAGVPYRVYQPDAPLPDADVIIDALLGTGVSRPVDGALGALVQAVNDAPAWVVAVDVPSGIDASTGEVRGLAVVADETVCMAFQKLGTAITPGCLFAGEVSVADIGIPGPAAVDDGAEPSGNGAALKPFARYITADWVRSCLPHRGPMTHKGSFGRVGIAVGQMQGAALLAALGAARAGAGLVVLGMPPGTVLQAPPEFVQRTLCEHDQAASVFEDCRSLVVGPGLGSDAATWLSHVRRHQGPGVLDADGLRLLQADPKLPYGQWVLTPHPKECARLLGWTTEAVQSRRLEAALALSRQTSAVVVLKGHRSLVVHPNGAVRVNPTGDASLATAGTGDVLAGIIGGLLAQGLNPFDAAAAGAWLHGAAGELAGQARSKISTMASDVVDCISRAISVHFDKVPGERR